MNELTIKRVSAAHLPVEAIPALLDQEKIDFQPVATVNWEEFPYRPSVQFRLAHTDDSLLLHFQVREASVRATALADNGRVWEDSCVEFFSVPAGDGVYYNLECNCAGTLLVGAGAAREGRQRAPQAVLDRVQRWASLGREPFAERIGACSWEVALIIPASTFFLHELGSFAGRDIRANFYKCGDLLQTPHFLSWNPIDLPKPDFHCPQFFGLLHLE